MINLLEIEEIDYEKEELTAVFDGAFPEGFIVKCLFSYDAKIDQKEDESLGLREHWVAENIVLHYIVIERDEVKINLNKTEMITIKNEIENKLTELLENYLND